jgi:hypothetical protein
MMTTERKSNRPNRKISVHSENARPSLDNYRDILTVEGKDPDYHYRWVLDESEIGRRIYFMKRAGYTFVDSDEVVVGESQVYKTENVGSVVRVPSGEHDSRYLYLMKIPMDLYEHNKDMKQERIDYVERQITRKRPKDGDESGMYGGVDIKRG